MITGKKQGKRIIDYGIIHVILLAIKDYKGLAPVSLRYYVTLGSLPLLSWCILPLLLLLLLLLRASSHPLMTLGYDMSKVVLAFEVPDSMRYFLAGKFIMNHFKKTDNVVVVVVVVAVTTAAYTAWRISSR